MQYFKLSQLIKDGIDINPIIDKILLLTISAKKSYPEYTTWFLNKHIPGIYLGTRDTIIAVDHNNIVGISNIKNDNEKKICTLYFRPEYRYKRIGKILVDKSIEALESRTPLITIPSSSIYEFKNIIRRYNWSLTDCIDDCYLKGESELIFNGELSNPNTDLTNEERILLTYKHTNNKNILKLVSFGYIKYFIFIKINNSKLKKSVFE